MRRFAHIINPVKVSKETDLYIAQPITFESIRVAREFAAGTVDVGLFTTQFAEDREIIPDYFNILEDLERSILDYKNFKIARKLPFIKDILDRAVEASDAEYIIHSETDISLMPYFYTVVNELINSGIDAFIINCRVIPNKYRHVNELSLMWTELGETHPGWDCFVFPREDYYKYDLGSAIVGANSIGRVLFTNLRFNAKGFRELKNSHLTFHIGTSVRWKDPDFMGYNIHNDKELIKILKRMLNEKEKHGGEVWLNEWYEECKDRIKRFTDIYLQSDNGKKPEVKSKLQEMVRRLKDSSHNLLARNHHYI